MEPEAPGAHATTATTEAPHAAAHQPSILEPQLGLVVWTVVTFVMLLIVLRKLAWGPMLKALHDREKAIKDALDRSAEARAEADKILADQKRILNDARKEAQDFLERTQKDNERAREALMVRAREESEKLIADGKLAIEQEKKAALLEIRTAAVDLALGAAARVIELNVDDARQRTLVKNFVDELAVK